MKAEILSYSRSRGLFAGISLEGSTLRSDNGANKNLYGRELGARGCGNFLLANQLFQPGPQGPLTFELSPLRLLIHNGLAGGGDRFKRGGSLRA